MSARFENPERIDRSTAVAAFASSDAATISRALVSVALHDPDGLWIEEQCLQLSDHDSPDVRGTAGLCLGHVARRFGVVLDESWVAALRLCDDAGVDNRPCDAVEDMRTFAGR